MTDENPVEGVDGGPFLIRLVDMAAGTGGEVRDAPPKEYRSVRDAVQAIRRRSSWMNGMGCGPHLHPEIQAHVVDALGNVVIRFVCIEVQTFEVGVAFGMNVTGKPTPVNAELRWIPITEEGGIKLLALVVARLQKKAVADG